MSAPSGFSRTVVSVLRSFRNFRGSPAWKPRSLPSSSPGARAGFTPDREAVVDGQRRFTYEDFFARCDRWSDALQRLGVARGDRVAYIAPNTHAPARIVLRGPADRRRARADQLPADRGRLRLHHQSQRRDRRLRRIPTISAAVDGIRRRAARPSVTSSRSMSAPPVRAGSATRSSCAPAATAFTAPGDRRARSPDDQLHERHDVAPEGRDDHPSQRLHEHRRHARPSSDDAAPTGTCGRCRCFMRTAGRSPGR